VGNDLSCERQYEVLRNITARHRRAEKTSRSAPESERTPEPDQRLHRRYPIALDAEYKLLDRGQITQFGPGRTLNISTGGLLLECSDPLPPGRHVEVSIRWPFLLAGTCPLKLLIIGRTLRAQGQVVAIKTNRHEFRTAPRAPRT
jgi:hypothetical protein